MKEIVGQFVCSYCKRVCSFERIIACTIEVRLPAFNPNGPIGCSRRKRRSPTARYVKCMPLPIARCTNCGQGLRFVGPTPKELSTEVDRLYEAEEREIRKSHLDPTQLNAVEKGLWPSPSIADDQRSIIPKHEDR